MQKRIEEQLRRIVCEQKQELNRAQTVVAEAMAEIEKLKANSIDTSESLDLLNARLEEAKKRIALEKVR